MGSLAHMQYPVNCHNVFLACSVCGGVVAWVGLREAHACARPHMLHAAAWVGVGGGGGGEWLGVLMFGSVVVVSGAHWLFHETHTYVCAHRLQVGGV